MSEVAVGRAEYQSVLNGQRSEIGIRHQVRLHARTSSKGSSKRFAFGYCQDFSNIVQIGSPAWPKVNRTRLKSLAAFHWAHHAFNPLSQHQIDQRVELQVARFAEAFERSSDIIF
jgi:hypothetical protein